VPCGGSGWPADLSSSGFSLNKLDVLDVTTFLAPARRLGTSPGDTDFNIRYDISPGAGVFPAFINVQDITTLVVLAPPMFGGQRAFNHTCP
jgi:hypothetical protein